MGAVHIPILDEDKLDDIITALQALSAPSGTDVAISPTGMHIVTEDDVQGAISELDSAVDSVNASLTYKYIGQANLNVDLALPDTWEVIIAITKNTEGKPNLEFVFPFNFLGAGDKEISNGFYANSGYYAYGKVRIRKTQNDIRLTDFTFTNSAITDAGIFVYYR